MARTLSPPRRAWLAPSAVGVAGVAGLAYLAVVDPARGGAFVPCPLHATTGLWCPGCGLTRATHRVVNGDLLGAMSVNLLTPIVLGLLAWTWAAWWWPAVSGRSLRSPATLPRALVSGLAVAAVVFGVLRNIPVAPLPALAP